MSRRRGNAAVLVGAGENCLKFFEEEIAKLIDGYKSTDDNCHLKNICLSTLNIPFLYILKQWIVFFARSDWPLKLGISPFIV